MRLAPVDGRDPRAVELALSRMLDGTGPAVRIGAGDPRPGRARSLPEEVADGTALVLGTSGSTGVPKSVVLSATALRASARATAERVGEGTWLLAMSTERIAGVQVLVRSILAGTAPVVIPAGATPAEFAAATARLPADGARLTSLVPAQLASLIAVAGDAPAVGAALASFDAILVGGQRTPPHVLAGASALGARIVRTYGSTETSGGCVYDGMPLDGVRLRIDDSGEVLVAGPMLADGYLQHSASDAAAGLDRIRTAASFPVLDGARWYRTGDLGTLDADGCLSITGRADNVIVSGGVNISLDRVEQAVHTVPGLRDAVIVGIPDARWGEASAVVTVTGSPADFEAARNAVREAVSAYAQPARLVRVDAMTVLASGKPDRVAARAAALAAIG